MSGRRPGLPGDYLDSLIPPAAPTAAARPTEGLEEAPEGAQAAAEAVPAAQTPTRTKTPTQGATGRSGPRAAPEADAEPPAAQPRARKERVTFQIDPRLVDEARDATVFLLTTGRPASLAGLVEAALEHELERLRAEHLGGKPFPQRSFAPPPGRRLGRP